MNARVGMSLASTVDDTTVIVVRTPSPGPSVTCGGVEMVEEKRPTGAGGGVSAEEQEPSQLGKRYVDDADTVEVLCTRAGVGRLAVDGQPLAVKAAKPLPASD